MSAAPTADRIEPHVWRIAFVVVIGSIMSILDTTIVNVALATLGRDLGSSLAQIQWVITGYMLSLAAVIPITGWAARRFGPKRIYLLSLLLFTAGSALCGLATSSTELILFRVVQGIGGGMILPIGQLMMAQAAGPRRMGRVMSVVAIPAMLAPIFGPTLGGLILDNASWRWIFYVNVPIGVVAFAAALRALPTGERAPTNPLDVRGLALMATGLPLLTYGLAEIGATGKLHDDEGRRSAVPRPGADRHLRRPRAAHSEPAARFPPVPAPDVRIRVDRDVLPRGRALRRDGPAAALLAASPARERCCNRPADGADGHRHGARDAARRAPHRPFRRRAAGADRRDRRPRSRRFRSV